MKCPTSPAAPRERSQRTGRAGSAQDLGNFKMTDRLDERSLSKLRWRCRRGLLENDLFVERFFRHHEETITTGQAAGLQALMDLPDNDLLDLLLARKEPDGGLDTPDVHDVLALMRRHGAHP
jgi:antitoxin CptB